MVISERGGGYFGKGGWLFRKMGVVISEKYFFLFSNLLILKGIKKTQKTYIFYILYILYKIGEKGKDLRLLFSYSLRFWVWMRYQISANEIYFIVMSFSLFGLEK